MTMDLSPIPPLDLTILLIVSPEVALQRPSADLIALRSWPPAIRCTHGSTTAPASAV
jgi:hypothetical protein